MPERVTVAYVGGPTVVFEFVAVRRRRGHRLFDPGGADYRAGLLTLRELRRLIEKAEQSRVWSFRIENLISAPSFVYSSSLRRR